MSEILLGPLKPAAALRWDGWRYGAIGAPLAFVALPLYVLLPHHYASRYGVPLALLGALLLCARVLDALADPFIGAWVDRWFARPGAQRMRALPVAAALLALGFHALFFPPPLGSIGLLAWCGAMLVLTYLAYSVLTVAHQAWGARLGGDAARRVRIVAWREGMAVVGVLTASVLPSLAGLGATSGVFAVTLALGLALLMGTPRPGPSALPRAPADVAVSASPLADAAFRRLLAVFLLNGIASAIPATLLLFFVRDRLQLPQSQAVFLLVYFAAGALAMPLWVRAARRIPLARLWLVGMALSVAAFVWAASLREGDGIAFALVCAASGLALGADLALPGAMLAGVVQRSGRSGRSEGSYFGWWNCAAKLNLALAAGLALPLLQWAGYAPGSRDEDALAALSFAYAVLPCVLKLAAAGLLHALWIRARKEDA